MELQDSRRLTGLNLLSTRAGAVAEVRFGTNEKPEDALQVWSRALDRLSLQQPHLRQHRSLGRSEEAQERHSLS